MVTYFGMMRTRPVKNREMKSDNFCMRRAVLTSYTSQRNFVKIFHMVNSYCARKDSMKKSYQRMVPQKVRKGQRSFLHAPCPLDLIHIAMKFQPDFPYGYQVMMRTMVV